MPTTTNFGWTTPADTDLVKDGASAMRTLAGGIDTSMAQLKGGTTGQILSKTSNTDMAFTWINNDQGDLTAVTAGTGISVTNGTGPIPTVAIDTATTVDKTTAQTLTNKTLTAPIISTISNTGTLTLPTSTDTLVGRATSDTLTNKTINGSSNTISNVSLTSGVTGTLPIANGGTNLTSYTTGDLPYASATNTLSKLGVGTTGQILTVSGGVPTWASPASSSSGLTLITSTTVSAATSKSIDNCFSSTYANYLIHIVLTTGGGTNTDMSIRLRASSTDSTSTYTNRRLLANQNGITTDLDTLGTDEWYIGNNDSNYVNTMRINLYNPYASTYTNYDTMAAVFYGGYLQNCINAGAHKSNTSYDGFTVISSANMTGTIRVYGYQNS